MRAADLPATHIVIHTFAFNGVAGLAEVRNWHTWPFYDARRKQHRYLGKWYNCRSDLPAAVRDKKGNGWLDIGYRGVIRRDGTIEHGRLTRPGAHCVEQNMNHVSWGWAFEGHGDYQAFTDAQMRSFIELYHREYASSIPVEHVIGHREAGAPKTCPGKKVDMNRFRQQLVYGLRLTAATV